MPDMRLSCTSRVCGYTSYAGSFHSIPAMVAMVGNAVMATPA